MKANEQLIVYLPVTPNKQVLTTVIHKTDFILIKNNQNTRCP